MSLSRQAVRRVAGGLAARGIVRFAPNPRHQRAKLVLPTERGRRALHGAAEGRQGPRASAAAPS